MKKDERVGATEPAQSVETPEAMRPPRPRSPLIIGGIACGTIVWMFVVIMILIAWRLFS